MQQVYCWLIPDGNNYNLSIQVLPNGKRLDLGTAAALQADCDIDLRRSTTTLQTILNWLDSFDTDKLYNHLDEVGMYALGEYLYQQTLGFYPHPEHLLSEQIALRIISPCPHIHRLPWNMLARDNVPLQAAGWHITLATAPDTRQVEWPALPSLLVVAPEPLLDNQGKRIQPTRSGEHIKSLRQRLIAHAGAYSTPEYFQEVTSWEALQRALQERHFDVLYYYGHGMASRLLFATTDKASSEDPRTFQDLRLALRDAKGGAPAVCYINACFGNSGGQMGAGLQLGAVCAAVVANRTAAVIQTAMVQGQEFLERLLLETRTPETALLDALTRCGTTTTGDVRWVTPILHRHYAEWKIARRPERFHLDKHDPHWEYKLDRITQSGELNQRIKFAIKSKNPATVCCLWYGCTNVGIDLFHERIPLELRELRQQVQIAHCRMDWPQVETGNMGRVWEECLLAGLRATATPFARAPDTLENIPRFLEQLAGQTGKRTLLHLRLKTINQQVLAQSRMTPAKLASFLGWWQDRVVSTILKSARIQTLITLGYELPDVMLPRMQGFFATDLDPLNDQYNSLSVYLLPQLMLLERRDLSEFIKAFYPDLPQDKAKARIEYILGEAKGNYQNTLNLLTDLNNDALYLQGTTQQASTGDDDFMKMMSMT
ncbi:MAG: hypothetical protein KJ914_01955 [Gammaproteobacteria bacterium]|nr:hypothetical protein [Gammaproteobacteria bacterium]MBU1724745.1 hypothetical protein [Gammaproteobacteria bacterium]MBU2005916.1 hypothetical protein [Gammaproteobacteria bacterium]